jgi:hypothetical protein
VEPVAASDDDRLRQVVVVGMEIVGAAGGGGVGLIGGPAGAIGGAAAGVALTRVLHRISLEVYDRLLVHRQQARVGAALVFAANDANELSATGAAIREDGFFDRGEEKRSDAEELMEGVLLHAADAYQELKLRHLAAIVPALASRPDVPAADGYWITDLASRLTWRQLVVLAIFQDPPEQVLMQQDIDQDVQGRQPLPGVLADEVEELAALGLIGTTNSDGDAVRTERTIGGLEGGVWRVGMAAWQLTSVGQLLADLTRLDDVPKAQRDRVLHDLLV